MADALIVALDQGTTSTRAILFHLAGRPLATAGRALPQSYPRDGWVEHDAETLFEHSVEVLRETVAAAPNPPAALGITNQRETVVVWDRDTGRPIHPAIVWQDRRTADVCARLKAEGAEPLVTERTGLLLDPYFSAAKIAWILDRVDGARAAASAGRLLAGTIDTWLIWRLTGGRVHAADATNASRTCLFDIERQAWDDDLLRLFDVPASLLPEVRDCAGDFGDTDPWVAGLSLPIRGVAGDQQAALMGQGCIRPGEMKATYGTGCFLLAHTGERRPRSAARLLATVAARLDGRTTYALEGSIFIAGAAIEWVQALLGLSSPSEVEALAQTAREGDTTMLVPAFTGLGAPWWDPDARGTVTGLTRDSGRAELAAAAFQACALQSLDLIEAIRHDAPEAFAAPELRIDGGMAVSRYFSQLLADVARVPVARADYAEATALGAALFAAIGAGLLTVEQAAERRPSSEIYQPEPSFDPAPLVGRWREAVGRARTAPSA